MIQHDKLTPEAHRKAHQEQFEKIRNTVCLDCWPKDTNCVMEEWWRQRIIITPEWRTAIGWTIEQCRALMKILEKWIEPELPE